MRKKVGCLRKYSTFFQNFFLTEFLLRGLESTRSLVHQTTEDSVEREKAKAAEV